MNIEEWAEEHIHLVTEFAEWWLENSKRDDIAYPLNMSVENWEEMFHIYVEDK